MEGTWNVPTTLTFVSCDLPASSHLAMKTTSLETAAIASPKRLFDFWTVHHTLEAEVFLNPTLRWIGSWHRVSVEVQFVCL